MSNLNFLREQILANAKFIDALAYHFHSDMGVAVEQTSDESGVAWYQAHLVDYPRNGKPKTLLTGEKSLGIEGTYKSLFDHVAAKVARGSW